MHIYLQFVGQSWINESLLVKEQDAFGGSQGLGTGHTYALENTYYLSQC